MRCALAIALVASFGGAGSAEHRTPNILLLVTDDQRPDTIGALGNPHIKTPHLDELTKHGLVFTRATCAHPLCYPSRAELLTGCTGFRNGAYSAVKLNEGVPLLPRILREAGYHTWYVGKWHTAGRPSTVGYEETDGLYAGGGKADDSYVDFRGRPATGYRGSVFQTDDRKLFLEKGVGLTPNISAEFSDAAIRLLGKKQPDKPFFLHVNFTAPHDPRIWPTEAPRVDTGVNRPDHGPLKYQSLYNPAKLPLPANFRPEHPFDHGNARGRDEVLLPFPRTEDDVRQELACYYAVITHLDAQIGRILKALDDMGQRENTIIIFTSDHGLAIGSHGLVGKQNMYEHTINVPLIIAGRGIPAGKQTTAQCYLRDLMPTICELAGVKLDQAIDAKSLSGLFRDPAAEIYPFIVGYFQDSQRMIREGRWKLNWYPKIDRLQLFNLQDDPHELSDLSAEPQLRERVAALRAKLTGWLVGQGDPLVTMLAPAP
jgi:arylsulfatase A-like enzyme